MMHFDTHLQLSINTTLIGKAIGVLHALKHPLRQQMLELMHRNQRIHVTGLYQELGLEQSIASQQLSILRRTALVKTERLGKMIYYSIDYAYLKQIEATCRELVGESGDLGIDGLGQVERDPLQQSPSNPERSMSSR